MPDIIDKSVSILEGVLDYYSSSGLIKELDTISNNIKDTLNDILDCKADKYDLLISNSVSTKKLYGINYRTKEPMSLKEKFIRKSDGLIFIQDANLVCFEDIANKPEVIKKHIKLLDDIIGIKIVTELKTDCKKVYDLILDHLALFTKKNIIFHDIFEQPLKMRNGLSIYNIKAIYQNDCRFELQIKSKIDSAWGDLDHTLFYKDYKTSPIKSTVQVSMNRIGMLLSELEHFLHDIRESDKEYNDRSQTISHCEILHNKLMPIICAKLRVEYDISGISSQLIYFCETLELSISNDMPEATFNVLDIEYDELTYGQYIKLRNSDYKLMILEATYMTWHSHVNSVSVTQSNYGEILDMYLQTLNNYLIAQIKYNDSDLDDELISNHITNCTSNLIKYISSPKLYLSPVMHIELIRQASYVNDYIDEEDVIAEELEYLLSANCIKTIGGDYELYLTDNREEPLESNVTVKLKDCIASMKRNDDINKKLVHNLEMNINSIIHRIPSGESNGQ